MQGSIVSTEVAAIRIELICPLRCGYFLVLVWCFFGFAFVGFGVLLFLFVLCSSLRVVAIAHGQCLDCVGVHALF